MRLLRKSIGAALAVTLSSFTGQAFAADVQALDAKVHKWTADMNAGNMKAFYAACAPHVAVVDGFPPYAWDSCQTWMRDYDANNRRVKAPRGTLTIGEPLWSDVNGDKALLTYAAVFTDVQDGKAMTYRGLWAVSFTHTKRGWLITGSGSSWRAD
jgi:ketosteroid isomerase-like protein